MEDYAGAERRHVNLATVLLRPLSGHRPGRCQACHAHVPQIGLQLTQPESLTPPRHGPASRISTRKNPTGGSIEMWVEKWNDCSYTGSVRQTDIQGLQNTGRGMGHYKASERNEMWITIRRILIHFCSEVITMFDMRLQEFNTVYYWYQVYSKLRLKS